MLKSKKAQAGETVSWIIATLVIIGILIIFIYASVLMSKVKVINLQGVQSDLTDKSKVLEEKTHLSNVILNNQDKEMIDNLLKNDK
jgi:hypothetical protein